MARRIFLVAVAVCTLGVPSLGGDDNQPAKEQASYIKVEVKGILSTTMGAYTGLAMATKWGTLDLDIRHSDGAKTNELHKQAHALDGQLAVASGTLYFNPPVVTPDRPQRLVVKVDTLKAAAAVADGSASGGAEALVPVKGIVTLKGQPLAAGRIVFHFGKVEYEGAVIKDGVYASNNIRPGRHPVTVEGTGVAARYTSKSTTPLVVEVKPGAEVAAGTYNFELQ
jgi:hypothetical protein